eukprot:6191882-Pleurochrysis_carterae.AAC.3
MGLGTAQLQQALYGRVRVQQNQGDEVSKHELMTTTEWEQLISDHEWLEERRPGTNSSPLTDFRSPLNEQLAGPGHVLSATRQSRDDLKSRTRSVAMRPVCVYSSCTGCKPTAFSAKSTMPSGARHRCAVSCSSKPTDASGTDSDAQTPLTRGSAGHHLPTAKQRAASQLSCAAQSERAFELAARAYALHPRDVHGNPFTTKLQRNLRFASLRVSIQAEQRASERQLCVHVLEILSEHASQMRTLRRWQVWRSSLKARVIAPLPVHSVHVLRA